MSANGVVKDETVTHFDVERNAFILCISLNPLSYSQRPTSTAIAAAATCKDARGTLAAE